jgi:hypothetical protein
LTALEVRGIKVEGSTTVVEVDARVCMTQAKASEDDLDKIKMFREIDADDSGELSLKEFKRLARQLIPDAADKTLEQIFRESDRDKTGSIDFEEYKQICVSKIMEEEEKVRAGGPGRVHGPVSIPGSPPNLPCSYAHPTCASPPGLTVPWLHSCFTLASDESEAGEECE